MSLFDDEIALAAADMFPSMADDIYVNGACFRGIFNDFEYEDATGIRREVSISFDMKDSALINVGDRIIFDNTKYVVKRLPKETRDDPFYTVEIIRA